MGSVSYFDSTFNQKELSKKRYPQISQVKNYLEELSNKMIMQINATLDLPWRPRGLIHHVSNSSRNRRVDPDLNPTQGEIFTRR